MVISTGDKDLAQLVDDRVTLINTMSNETLDVAGVMAKFGVPPERIVDYLTLIGDAVDNVPGVDKVGPEDGRQVDRRARLARRRDRRAPTASRAWPATTCARRWTGCRTGRSLVTVSTDCDLAGHVLGWPALECAGAGATSTATAARRSTTRFGFKA